MPEDQYAPPTSGFPAMYQQTCQDKKSYFKLPGCHGNNSLELQQHNGGGSLGSLVPTNYGSTAPSVPAPPYSMATQDSSLPSQTLSSIGGVRGKEGEYIINSSIHPPELDYTIFGTIKPWQPSPGDQPLYDGPDVPTTDLPEDYNAPEPQALPPDVTKLQKIPGYEGVGYYGSSLGPPIPPPKSNEERRRKDPPSREEQSYSSVAMIGEEVARDALITHVAQQCCYGKLAASDMQIRDVSPSSALHYTLETFIETRCTAWEQEPYKGQPIDGPSNGAAPGPWAIECVPTNPFHNEIHHLEVPHSATITPCHGCGAKGWMRCHSCLGRGFKRCITCHGSGREWKTDAHGHRHVDACWHCHGTGRKRCLSCTGDGRVVCRTCQGFRHLKCFIKLTVTYTNNVAEEVVDKTDIPVGLVKNVGGFTIFEELEEQVWPITYYADEDVCSTSQRLVQDHLSRFQHARIVMQHQTLRAVPVSECAYTWKNRQGRFWVYGKENEAYAPEYPQKYCWGCNIL